MRESVRLATVAGINVGVNWSVLVILALVAIMLGLGSYPQLYPGYSDGTYLLAGIITALLFFGSIFAHEMGHALLARRRGIDVDGIVLWLLGGVAKFRSEARSPRDEIAIALIGPAVSLGLGVAFAAAAVAAAQVTGDVETLAVGLLGWLGGINVLLALFNVLPAAPLDGGRVLRGILWATKGDAAEAAGAAARAGKAFGVALIGLGVLLVAALASFQGIWLMLVGWFLMTAANAEEFHARLKGVTARDVMTPDPVTAPDWISVRQLIDDHVLTQRCSTFPLRGFDERVTGVVTLSAIKATSSEARDELRARDIAVPREEAAVAAPDDELTDLLANPAAARTDGRVLVFDAGELVGVVSPSDVGRAERLRGLRPATRRPDEPTVTQA